MPQIHLSGRGIDSRAADKCFGFHIPQWRGDAPHEMKTSSARRLYNIPLHRTVRNEHPMSRV
jgi:hypothetical protein